MSDHGSAGASSAPERGPDTGKAVCLDNGHVVGDGGIPEQFTNPGLPPHQPRHADVDPKAAKRAERQVLLFFTLSILGTIGFVVAYFVIDKDAMFFMPFFGTLNTLHTVIGVCMGVSLLGIGLGAVHWAKTLMPDEEVVEMRHPMRSADEDRAGVGQTLKDGLQASQLGRRPMIGLLGGTALGIFAVPPVLQLVGGLGTLPGADKSETFWQAGMRLMLDPQGTPIKASDVTIGSAFHVLPEHMEATLEELDQLGYVSEEEKRTGVYRFDQELGYLERKAKAPVLLMRVKPEDITDPKMAEWGYQGIVAYNKICTHAGCPVGLYEQQTGHLLCPCHQSTFDLFQDCKVVFGPAKRPLPQLPITVDNEGYLVAARGFEEPVGPSFWERG